MLNNLNKDTIKTKRSHCNSCPLILSMFTVGKKKAGGKNKAAKTLTLAEVREKFAVSAAPEKIWAELEMADEEATQGEKPPYS